MRALPGFLVLLTVVAAARAADAPDSPAPLARFVPADVGLFIEGGHIDDLLLALTEPQAWLMLAELGGQPATLEDTAQWRERVRQTVGMELPEAVRLLFSERFAFVAEGAGRAQDAVILCRPTVDPRTLAQRWGAVPVPTSTPTPHFQLPSRIGLALPDGLLMFGDDSLPDGMFKHVLTLADAHRQPSLADDPAFLGLLKRVPDQPDALLFARLGRRRFAPRPIRTPTSTSAPSDVSQLTRPELPGPLRGANNVMLALHRGDGLLHFTAVGDAPSDRRPAKTGLTALVERLPARTLATWGVHLDYPQLLHSIGLLPDNSLLRMALRLQERSGTAERLVAALDSATCVAIGTIDPPSRTVLAPPVPAIGVLIATHQPQAVAAEMGTVLNTTASVCNLLALKTGAPLLPPIETVTIDNDQVWRLDLSELIRGQPGGAGIAELHVCWATDGDTLIIASHIDWLRQILAARHGDAPTLAGLLALSQRPPAPTTETLIAVQPGPIADLGNLWLAYLTRTVPEALKESWWRTRQPGGSNVQLGIQVADEPEQRRLRVTSVAVGTPADGSLRPGDRIVGCGGKRFATSQPVHEIRKAIDDRPNARWVELDVERAGGIWRQRIPLPFVDPVQILRQAIAIGQIAQRAVYYDDVAEDSGARGFLTVELRKAGQPPLFPFHLTPSAVAASQATSSAPTTTSAPTTAPVLPSNP